MKKFIFSLIAMLIFSVASTNAVNYSFENQKQVSKQETKSVVIIDNFADYKFQKVGIVPYSGIGVFENSNNNYIALISKKITSPAPAFNVQLHIDPGRYFINMKNINSSIL